MTSPINCISRLQSIENSALRRWGSYSLPVPLHRSGGKFREHSGLQLSPSRLIERSAGLVEAVLSTPSATISDSSTFLQVRCLRLIDLPPSVDPRKIFGWSKVSSVTSFESTFHLLSDWFSPKLMLGRPKCNLIHTWGTLFWAYSPSNLNGCCLNLKDTHHGIILRPNTTKKHMHFHVHPRLAQVQIKL